MQATVSSFNDRFYSSRHRLLSYLLKLGHAIDSGTQDLAQALLLRFCDALVDYLSTGHFQILEKFQPRLDQVAAFEATTRQALAFSDRFGNADPFILRELRVHLEQLAFVLDSRMDVEDEVLQGATLPPARQDNARARPLTPALA